MSDGSAARRRFMRTEFLTRVAHDLRGPAGVTLGALDELELRLASSSSTPEEASRTRALFGMARRGTRKALRTAESLARAAQLESEDAVMERVRLDVRDVVRDATEEAATLERRASVHLRVVCPDAPCWAAVDGNWLGAAIRVLVSESLRRSTSTVEVTLERKGPRLFITVEDDRTTRAEPLRQRFSPSDLRTDLGLDLPLVYDVTRLHGGTVEIADVVRRNESSGLGVRVQLSLPT